jgi:hypothetical protein
MGARKVEAVRRVDGETRLKDGDATWATPHSENAEAMPYPAACICMLTAAGVDWLNPKRQSGFHLPDWCMRLRLRQLGPRVVAERRRKVDNAQLREERRWPQEAGAQHMTAARRAAKTYHVARNVVVGRREIRARRTRRACSAGELRRGCTSTPAAIQPGLRWHR